MVIIDIKFTIILFKNNEFVNSTAYLCYVVVVQCQKNKVELFRKVKLYKYSTLIETLYKYRLFLYN